MEATSDKELRRQRTRQKQYTVAYLAGDGIGPELIAEASRALQAVTRMHGFTIVEVHAPFGGEAVSRFGHRLPDVTRAAYRDADAVLVASTKDQALEGVKADLDLTWRIQRVGYAPGRDIALVSSLVDDADELAAERAVELACERHGRLTSVGDGEEWHGFVDRAADRHPGLEVRQLSLEQALPMLAHQPEGFSVVATQRPFAEALSHMAAFMTESAPIVAAGRLSEHGPGVFGPTHGSAPSIAGQGIANPTGILLAASMLLADGLGERAAGRTLERAMTETVVAGLASAETGRTTRSFVDGVIEMMPSARTDVEFFAEVRS
jgi:3-isopropylmalate dehydrogenase